MLELIAAGASAHVDTDRGARLASLVIGGQQLIVGPPDAIDRSTGWGSFLMAPWAGRIENGILEFDGRRHVLPTRGKPHAIHGVVLDRSWSVEHVSATEAIVTCPLGGDGWPFVGQVRQRFALSADALVQTAEVEAAERMPVTLGWHPWFVRGVGPSPRVTVSADEVLELESLIPTGRRIPVDERTDLRRGPPIDGRALDHVYVAPGSPAVIRWPTLELRAELEPPVDCVVVHTREDRFCVEPQTGWPNAAVLSPRGVPGTGLTVLERGGSLRATVIWRWRPLPGGE
jgi:aldose 1-epimerase